MKTFQFLSLYIITLLVISGCYSFRLSKKHHDNGLYFSVNSNKIPDRKNQIQTDILNPKEDTKSEVETHRS